MAHDFPNHPSGSSSPRTRRNRLAASPERVTRSTISAVASRSEEHTSELQSQSNLVCRLLLEKKKQLFPPPLEFHCGGGYLHPRSFRPALHLHPRPPCRPLLPTHPAAPNNLLTPSHSRVYH